MKKAILLTVAILLSLVSLDYALETDTHELINEYIVINALNGFSLHLYLKEQLNIDKGIEEIFGKNEVSEWLKKGGKYEDKPNWHTFWGRSVNHFHNPLTDEGYSGIWGVSWLSGVSSVQWSQKPVGTQSPGGHYSWHDVREYFYIALTAPTKSERDENFAETFRGLGQLMHLVQDLSVPAHTRDDGHLGYLRYNYETWAQRNIENISIYDPEYFDSSALDIPNPLAAVPVANLFDTNQYDGSNPDITVRSDIGLSEYTNANFFSNDTIFNDFPYPAKDSVFLDDISIPDPRYPDLDILRKYFHKVSDGDTGYRLATVSFLEGSEEECNPYCSDWFYENAALDSEVYGDYAAQLIPRAVGYSAGLLEYFFRGKIEMVDDDVAGDGYVIVNKSDEDMDGVFELYYDNMNDERIQIESGDFPITTVISGNTTSGHIDFTAPDDAKKPGEYILAFKGRLGNELEAIVGFIPQPCAWEPFDGPEYNSLRPWDARFSASSLPPVIIDQQLVWRNVEAGDHDLWIRDNSYVPKGRYIKYRTWVDVHVPSIDPGWYWGRSSYAFITIWDDSNRELWIFLYCAYKAYLPALHIMAESFTPTERIHDLSAFGLDTENLRGISVEASNGWDDGRFTWYVDYIDFKDELEEGEEELLW
ncbi:MAG: hypothetical protein JXB42_01945 [Deltaproteobacteria bacterium]|nr:hypothetical protein [Deltaproteobacteria bacterium]